MPAGRPAGRPEISLRKSLRKSLSPAQPTPCFEKGPRSLLENGRFLRPHEAYSFAEIISFIRNLYKWNNFPHLYKWKKIISPYSFGQSVRCDMKCLSKPPAQQCHEHNRSLDTLVWGRSWISQTNGYMLKKKMSCFKTEKSSTSDASWGLVILLDTS